MEETKWDRTTGYYALLGAIIVLVLSIIIVNVSKYKVRDETETKCARMLDDLAIKVMNTPIYPKNETQHLIPALPSLNEVEDKNMKSILQKTKLYGGNNAPD